MDAVGVALVAVGEEHQPSGAAEFVQGLPLSCRRERCQLLPEARVIRYFHHAVRDGLIWYGGMAYETRINDGFWIDGSFANSFS